MKLFPEELQNQKAMDIIYFTKCSKELPKQKHTILKINVSPLPNAHRSYFSVKNLPSQEDPVKAYLEIMSPEEMAKAPFNTDKQSL